MSYRFTVSVVGRFVEQRRITHSQIREFLNYSIVRRLATRPSPKTADRYGRYLVISSLALGGALYYSSLDLRTRRKVRGTFDGFRRFFRTIWTGSVTAVDYKWHLRGLEQDGEVYNTEITHCHERAADRVLRTLLKNGGLYIKMGQAVSAAGMANMVPKEFATKLQVLQDQALVMRPDELDELFLEDFGVLPDKLFSSLNRTPIAAASLAQVFRATTNDGQDVAVKCQYLDLRDRYAGDIRTVELVLNALHWLFPQFMGHWIFGEVKGTLAMELDFMNEGRNSEKCAKDLSHLPFLYVPKVFWQLTSERVLTTEFIDHAAKITEVEKIRKMGLSVADVNKKFLTIFGEQVFRSGFVHADPHPGNIFIRPNESGQPQIVLLDHGLYETLPENVRISICHIFKATVLADHSEMKRYSDYIGMPDYKLFASILVGRPIGQGRKMLLGLKKEFSKADMEAFRTEMEGMMDSIQATVKAMPKSLFLVMRNMNLVRAICVVHGNPNDRYTLFARIASQAVMDDIGVKAPSIPNSIAAVSERLHFEWKLFLHYFSNRLFVYLMQILSFMGMGPFYSGFGPPRDGEKAVKF